MTAAPSLTAAHWVYLVGVVVIILTMVRRANVVAPAIAATFCTALALTGDFPRAVEALFLGPLTAARELFNIFLVIALMTGFMNALRVLGADIRMVRPFRRVMINGHAGYFILGAVSYAMSLFFWPTPSVPLIAGILLPAAIASGLPPMGAAMCIAIAGLGTALSSDYVIKVGPGITAKAAGVAMTDVADKGLVLSLIVGGVAFLLAYLQIRRTFVRPDAGNLLAWEALALDAGASPHAPVPARAVEEADDSRHAPWGQVFAILTPAVFAAVVIYMVLPHLVPGMKGAGGAAAAALVGGTAAALLLLATAAAGPRDVCRAVAAHITEGFVFAFRAMGSVLSIAGFFFIGVANTAGPIIGLPAGAPAPGLLAELVRAGEAWTPHNPFFAAFGILLSGMISGIDGSGFAGLPLTGALAGALGRSVGMDVSTLAAVGQMGAVWTGKTLCAWSALAAVAGFSRVAVLELVRRLLPPVVCGLVVATLFAVAWW
jgi:hypothetical protein